MKREPQKNFSEKDILSAVLLLKLQLLEGICRKNNWRYDCEDLKYRINRYGSEAVIVYVKRDQILYHRVVHVMISLISERDKKIRFFSK